MYHGNIHFAKIVTNILNPKTASVTLEKNESRDRGGACTVQSNIDNIIETIWLGNVVIMYTETTLFLAGYINKCQGLVFFLMTISPSNLEFMSCHLKVNKHHILCSMYSHFSGLGSCLHDRDHGCCCEVKSLLSYSTKQKIKKV